MSLGHVVSDAHVLSACGDGDDCPRLKSLTPLTMIVAVSSYDDCGRAPLRLLRHVFGSTASLDRHPHAAPRSDAACPDCSHPRLRISPLNVVAGGGVSFFARRPSPDSSTFPRSPYRVVHETVSSSRDHGPDPRPFHPRPLLVVAVSCASRRHIRGGPLSQS